MDSNDLAKETGVTFIRCNLPHISFGAIVAVHRTETLL
jgi:hypothetical protein